MSDTTRSVPPPLSDGTVPVSPQRPVERRGVGQGGDVGDPAGSAWQRVPMTSARAVAELAAPSVRRAHVALVQLVKDWNHGDESRRRELLEPPTRDGACGMAMATVASIAHALVVRDGGIVPAWVVAARAPNDVTTCGAAVTSPLGRQIVAAAPATCAQHRVYFDSELLNRR